MGLSQTKAMCEVQVAVLGDTTEGLKRCCRCKVSQPLDAFPRLTSAKDGRQKRCRQCFADLQREYRKKRPRGYWKNKDRRYTLKKRYGISLEEYERRMREQSGLCAICGKDPTTMGIDHRHQVLHVDHDHRTGEVRGLLCNGCNRAVGLICEDAATARGLVAYLERHRR